MREPDPRHERCLRCGEPVSYPETGRPREYCGDACRQGGARLRRKHGYYWWKRQPWYPIWLAEEAAWHERWEAGREERERKQAEERAEAEAARAAKQHLIDSMPDDARKAYKDAERQARRRSMEDMGLVTLRLKLETISLENDELLKKTGHQIQLIDNSARMDKLLRSALYADNEAEAAAMFAKARQLRAAGNDLDETPTAIELLTRSLRGLGGAAGPA